MRQVNYALIPERPLDTPVYRKYRPYLKPAASTGVVTILAAKRRSREDARPTLPAPWFQDDYTGCHHLLAPQHPFDTPAYRKGRPAKPKLGPYPNPRPALGQPPSSLLGVHRVRMPGLRSLHQHSRMRTTTASLRSSPVTFPSMVTPVAPNTTYGNSAMTSQQQLLAFKFTTTSLNSQNTCHAQRKNIKIRKSKKIKQVS